MNWEYGEYYKKYDFSKPIQIGTGIIAQNDIMNGIPDWFKCETIITDPPCSQGNLQFFATKNNNRRLEKDAYNNFNIALEKAIISSGCTKVYMEVFKSNIDFWKERLKCLFNNVSIIPSFYYKKKDNQCFFILAGDTIKINEIKDESEIIREICNKERGPFGDPCMGLGLVGYWANFYNKNFVGTELNHKRLACLIESINCGHKIGK